MVRSIGAALKKTIYTDRKPIGESAPHTYFYRKVPPGEQRCLPNQNSERTI
jgi:hypothetical protein